MDHRVTTADVRERISRHGYSIARLLSENLLLIQGADATFWILSDDDLWLHPVVSVNTDASFFEAMKTPADSSRIGLVAALGEPIIIGPEDAHNQTVEQLTGITTENMAACPVFLRGDLFGVLSCIRSDPVHRFDRADLDRLEWVAFLIEAILGVEQ
jgi:hypothetical protein